MVEKTGIDRAEIVGIGISNQRETALVWDRESGLPVYDAIVWQCARGAKICEGLSEHAEMIRERTGLRLSPYFFGGKDRLGAAKCRQSDRKEALLRNN